MIPRVLTSVGFAPYQQIFRKKSKLVSFKNLNTNEHNDVANIKGIVEQKIAKHVIFFISLSFQDGVPKSNFQVTKPVTKKVCLVKNNLFYLDKLLIILLNKDKILIYIKTRLICFIMTSLFIMKKQVLNLLYIIQA